MRSGHYHSTGGDGTAVGVDVGATLAKLAVRDRSNRARFDLLPADAPERVAAWVVEAKPTSIGLTGCGASTLAPLLSLDTARVSEFDAWGAGAAALLGEAPAERYLLVSVGTGTSMMLVDGVRVTRIGGTALGGGTVLGLGRLLVGSVGFSELCALAGRGDRRRVDLSLADIYPSLEDAPLPGELTAAAFARMARPGGAAARPEDLAHAVMGMVAENVAIIAGALAAASGVERLVFGGATLRGNPVLREILADIVGRLGRSPAFLESGEFGAAYGALLVAARQP